jgi:drug/metabolite transporter (DMT)-like permease
VILFENCPDNLYNAGTVNNILSGQYTVNRNTAILLMLGTAIFWSLGGMLIKMVNCNPLAISGVRSAITCIFLLILIKRPRFTWSRLQIGGALSFSATVFTFVAATRLTTAANAILLQYTAPIYIALLSVWLLREKIGLTDIVALVAALAGLVLFFLDELSASGLEGNIIALTSGVSWAFFFVFTRMDKGGPIIETILLGNIITAVIGTPFVFGQLPDVTGWIILVVLGIVQLGLPYILYSIAIRNVPALQAILICTLEPILNPVWVLIVIGEKPGMWALIGGIIVLISVTVRNILSISKLKDSST